MYNLTHQPQLQACSRTMPTSVPNKTLLRQLLSLWSDAPPTLGAVDVLCLEDEPVGALAAAFLLLGSAEQRGTGHDGFRQVVVVVPSGAGAFHDFHDACSATCAAYAKRDLVDDALTHLTVRTATRLDSAGTIDALGDVPKRSAVVIARAASYGHPSGEVPFPNSSESRTVFGERIRMHEPETLWVESIVGLAGSLASMAVDQELYVLLITGVAPPTAVTAMERLHSIPGAVFHIGRPVAPSESSVASKHMAWIAAARRHRDDEWFLDVDQLEGASQWTREFLKAQILFAAGRGAHAAVVAGPYFAEIESNAEPNKRAAVLITLARIAIDGGDVVGCASLLAAATREEVATAFDLRAIVQIAAQLDLADVEGFARERMEQRYPIVAAGLPPQNTQPDPAAAGAQLVLAALDRWALSVPGGASNQVTARRLHREAVNKLLRHVPNVFQYLGDHPEDTETRTRVMLSLDRDRTGAFGAALLTATFVRTPQSKFVERDADVQSVEPADDEQVLSSVALYFETMKQQRQLGANRQPHGARFRGFRHPHGATRSPGSWSHPAGEMRRIASLMEPPDRQGHGATSVPLAG